MPAGSRSTTRSSATGCLPTGSLRPGSLWRCAWCGGSVRTMAGGACSGRRRGVGRSRSQRTTTWCSAGSPWTARTRFGSPTSPSIARARASSVSARSRRCGPTESSAAASATGWSPRSRSTRSSQPLPAGLVRWLGACFTATAAVSSEAEKRQQALFHHRIVGSLGQAGSAGVNAAMESFFSLLQRNVVDRQRWETREELRITILTWIERTYHHRRRKTDSHDRPQSSSKPS